MNPTTPQRLALAVGAVQLFLALSWTVYIIFLPGLAAEAGIAPERVPWVLALSYLLFAACDWEAGLWADRIGRTAGRIGRTIVAATAVSCVAFLVLPFVAPGVNRVTLVILIAVWSATSAALRAPPLVLIAHHAARPNHPLLAALLLLGLGVAGAAAPYLATMLREMDPRIPFLFVAFALLAVTWALATAESEMPPPEPAAEVPEPVRAAQASSLPWFLGAVVLLGAAFQVHVAVNSEHAYLKFAGTDMLERLMPLFWIGFSLAVVPGAKLTKIWGGPLAMALGAVVAAAASFVVASASHLNTVIVAQLIAGAGWGLALTGAVVAALSFGHGGAEGKFSGGLYAMLSVVALVRLLSVATETAKAVDMSAAFPWTPTLAWLLAAMVLLCMLAYGKARSA